MKLDMNGTTAKQRKAAVKIAEDVLLTMRYLAIETGSCYMRPTPKIADTQSVKGMPASSFKKCQVCGVGAMFVSRARLWNNVVFPEASDDWRNLKAVVEEDIGIENSGLIESAFELRPGYAELSHCDPELVGKAIAFGHKNENPRRRLRAIMKNVIANKGVFRP